MVHSEVDAGHAPDSGPSGVDTIVLGDQCAYPHEPGPVPPRYNVRGGVEHWSLEPGCVDITHQPNLDPSVVAQLAAAVDAFNAVECSQLCLSAPEARAFDPALLDVSLFDALDSLERRLHFMVDRRSMPNAALPEIHTDSESAEVVGGFVFLPEAPDDPPSAGDLVQWLGASLGLGAAAEGVDSVMSPERPQTRHGPTPLDEALLCELYGSAPLCE